MNSFNLWCLRKYFIFIFEDLFYSVVNSRLTVFSFSRVVAPLSSDLHCFWWKIYHSYLYSLFPLPTAVLWNEHLLNFSDETDWCWRQGEILSPMSFRGYSKHSTFFPAVFKTLSLLLSNLRCAFVLFPSCFLYLEFIDFLGLWNYSSSDWKHFSHYFLQSIFFFRFLPFFYFNSSCTCGSPLEVVLQLTNDTFTFFIVFTHCFILGRYSSPPIFFFWSTSSVFNPNKHISCQTL